MARVEIVGPAENPATKRGSAGAHQGERAASRIRPEQKEESPKEEAKP